MEDLPSELHRYLASFIDDSTQILFPLTCVSLYNSLGLQRIDFDIAVEKSARDNNISLMFYFMDKCDKRKKGFYQSRVLIPALQGNSQKVLEWFYSKKYKMDFIFLRPAIQTISINTLDKYVFNLKKEYNDEILQYVFQGDRVDILTEKYMNHCDFIRIFDSCIDKAIDRDAEKCFFKLIEGLTTEKENQFIGKALSVSGERIISAYMMKSLSIGIPLHKDYIDKILCNYRCSSLSFFAKLLSHHTLSHEQNILVIQHKNLEIVKFVMDSVEVNEEHCKQALLNLTQDTFIYGTRIFDVATYLFSRYSGKISFVTHRRLCLNTPCYLQNQIACRLENIACMEKCIFYERNTELFRRFIDEVTFQEHHFSLFIEMGSKMAIKMLKIYLEKHTVPEEFHLTFYLNLGEDFYQLMIEMKQTISNKTLKRRLMFLRRRERKVQKECESKRLRIQ